VPALIFGTGSPNATLVVTNGKREVRVAISGRLLAKSFPALLRAAEAGAGVALAPEIVANPYLAGGTLVRVLPRWQPASSPILLVYRPGHQRIRRVAALIEFATQSDSGVPS
jgi:DNA-binding transcriptional LysR family regulator